MVKGIEGENDFSGKRYVWLKDPQQAFVKGWVVEELGGNRILVQCDDGSVRALSFLLPSLSCWLNANARISNVKPILRPSTRSTRPSSTRRMTWPNSPTSMKRLSFITFI